MKFVILSLFNTFCSLGCVVYLCFVRRWAKQANAVTFDIGAVCGATAFVRLAAKLGRTPTPDEVIAKAWLIRGEGKTSGIVNAGLSIGRTE